MRMFLFNPKLTQWQKWSAVQSNWIRRDAESIKLKTRVVLHMFHTLGFYKWTAAATVIYHITGLFYLFNLESVYLSPGLCLCLYFVCILLCHSCAEQRRERVYRFPKPRRRIQGCTCDAGGFEGRAERFHCIVYRIGRPRDEFALCLVCHCLMNYYYYSCLWLWLKIWFACVERVARGWNLSRARLSNVLCRRIKVSPAITTPFIADVSDTLCDTIRHYWKGVFGGALTTHLFHDYNLLILKLLIHKNRTIENLK